MPRRPRHLHRPARVRLRATRRFAGMLRAPEGAPLVRRRLGTLQADGVWTVRRRAVHLRIL